MPGMGGMGMGQQPMDAPTGLGQAMGGGISAEAMRYLQNPGAFEAPMRLDRQPRAPATTRNGMTPEQFQEQSDRMRAKQMQAPSKPQMTQAEMEELVRRYQEQMQMRKMWMGV